MLRNSRDHSSEFTQCECPATFLSVRHTVSVVYRKSTTDVVDYRRSFFKCLTVMKEFPISTRYTAAELKQLDATAKQCKISRAELIHARSLGKIVTTHELADWAEAELAKNASRKARRGARAA
jgi:hypothetical protein